MAEPAPTSQAPPPEEALKTQLETDTAHTSASAADPAPAPAAAMTSESASAPAPLPSPPSNAPMICVVGFHHARGPEIEGWFGVPSGTDPAADNDWSFLPFMALSDGAHTSAEDFSYFTLRQKLAPPVRARSLFGISCTRQLDARELKVRPKDVTRSTVQKSVVVLAPRAAGLAAWREKLGLVTRAWFLQRDFADTEILKDFQESLAASEEESNADDDQYLGISLREFIHEFKHNALVLFKCCLLQPKMLFFGSRCERLCMVQFALISLIPGLVKHLEDCADPELDSFEKSMAIPSSLKTSDRNSLLAYMGLPLQVFGKGSFFGPYTPLQQLDVLADSGTMSYIVGSTNSLLLQQRDRYSDILINLDDNTLTINSASLRHALNLTVADRRWIDSLHQTIVQTWDPADPARPRHHGYLGSEDFLRVQFEEYLLALLAATKYHNYLYATPRDRRELTAFADIEGDPAMDWGEGWLAAWQGGADGKEGARNHALWQRATDPHLFDLVEPRHPNAGAFSIEDLQRRFAHQVADLRLDEKWHGSREQLGKHLAHGRERVSSALAGLVAEVEARRQQRASRQPSSGARSSEDANSPNDLPSPSAFAMPDTPPSARTAASTNSGSTRALPDRTPTRSASQFFEHNAAAIRARAPDLSGAGAAVGAAGQKAGAYLSSSLSGWGSWASEKRKGWGGGSGATGGATSPVSPGATAAAAAALGQAAGDRSSMDREPGSAGAQPMGRAEPQTPAALSTEKSEHSSPVSPPRPRTSPRKSTLRGKVREEVGSDGIGRLDA